MITFLIDLLGFFKAVFRSRYNLGLEILALRQQLGVLKRKHPRPQLQIHDRIFWILLHRLWPAWSNVLVIVKPETVVARHRTGFRWIASCRRELLDQVIVHNDVHLRRLMRDYISYYHTDRIHDSLEKATPAMRPVSSKPGQSARLVSFPRIGGLHHRYDWQQAA
jgi:hypothetical protein